VQLIGKHQKGAPLGLVPALVSNIKLDIEAANNLAY